MTNMNPGHVTVDVHVDTQPIYDKLTELADVLIKAGGAMCELGTELYRTVAPDTDVADEQAATRRVLDSPLIRAMADASIPTTVQHVHSDPAPGSVNVGGEGQ